MTIFNPYLPNLPNLFSNMPSFQLHAVFKITLPICALESNQQPHLQTTVILHPQHHPFSCGSLARDGSWRSSIHAAPGRWLAGSCARNHSSWEFMRAIAMLYPANCISQHPSPILQLSHPLLPVEVSPSLGDAGVINMSPAEWNTQSLAPHFDSYESLH